MALAANHFRCVAYGKPPPQISSLSSIGTVCISGIDEHAHDLGISLHSLTESATTTNALMPWTTDTCSHHLSIICLRTIHFSGTTLSVVNRTTPKFASAVRSCMKFDAPMLYTHTHTHHALHTRLYTLAGLIKCEDCVNGICNLLKIFAFLDYYISKHGNSDFSWFELRNTYPKTKVEVYDLLCVFRTFYLHGSRYLKSESEGKRIREKELQGIESEKKLMFFKD